MIVPPNACLSVCVLRMHGRDAIVRPMEKNELRFKVGVGKFKPRDLPPTTVDVFCRRSIASICYVEPPAASLSP